MIAPSLPMKEGGSDSSVTRSAVSEGTVIITNEEAQKAKTGQSAEETIASLNRDTENAHQGPLDHNPDLEKILDKQSEISDAASAAGKAVAETVGDIAVKLYEKTGDDQWAEGGAYKALLQAAGSALVAQIGNGAGLDAALGSIASQLAAGQTREVIEQIARQVTDDPQGQSFISEILTNATAGAVGGLAGGETGANAAAIMDRFNRQLHKQEEERIAALLAENENLEDDRMRAAACALTRCYAQFPKGSADYEKYLGFAQWGQSGECLAEMQVLLDNVQKGSFKWVDGQKVPDLGLFYYSLVS